LDDDQSLAAPMVPRSQRGPQQRSWSSVDGPHAPAATAFAIADQRLDTTDQVDSVLGDRDRRQFALPRTMLGITDASMTRGPW